MKNEVTEPVVRQRVHRNKGLRGPSRQYKTTRQKSIFSSRKFGLYINTLQYGHSSLPVHESRTRQPAAKNTALEHTPIRFTFRRAFHGDGSPVRFFISTTEHGVTRAFRNANRARVTSQLFCPERDLHSCYLFIRLLSFPRSPSLYQVKINNSTTVQQQQHTQYPYTFFFYCHDPNLQQ